jgi:hypothetical protein
MRYRTKYDAEFVFGLQTLAKGLGNKGNKVLGNAERLAKKGKYFDTAGQALKEGAAKTGHNRIAQTAQKQALKQGNSGGRLLGASNLASKVDKTLTSGVLGTDIGQLAKNARNNVANKFTNARKGLNKRAGVLGTDVKDAKELLPNSRTNKLKKLDKLLKQPVPSYRPVASVGRLNASPLYIQNRNR